jgi:hypothetical protein
MQLSIFDQWNDERRISVHENENELQRASRLLKSKVIESYLLHTQLASILDHMILLPGEGPQSLVYWEVLDRFIVHTASTSYSADKVEFVQEIASSVVRQLHASSAWPPDDLDAVVHQHTSSRKGASTNASVPSGGSDAADQPPPFVPAELVSLPAPPPPPPMGMRKEVPKKPAIKPSVPLNGFVWSQMNYNDAKGTFWQDVKEDTVALDLNEIERLFQKSMPKLQKDPSAAATSTSTSTYVHAIHTMCAAETTRMLCNLQST